MSNNNNWDNRQCVSQVFVGRWEQASLLRHKGEVLSRLTGENWQSLADFGVDWIYLLGMFDNRGELVVTEEEGVDLNQVENRLPSPFALRDHKKVLPDLGSEDDFRKLVSRIKESGMRVMVDFVPNHTGLFHPWIEEHPDYYVWRDSEMAREFSGDVVKLNYDNPKLREEMIEVLLHHVSLGVQGFRCDMAHLVPNVFWAKAIGRVREEHPETVFVAEAYPNSLFDESNLIQLIESGFDAVYDEPLYRNVRQVLVDDSPVSDFIGYVEHKLARENPATFMHYILNHDDSLPADDLYFPALMTLSMTLPGPILLFNGVLHGKTRRLAHHYYQELSVEETKSDNIVAWVRKLMEWRKDRKWEFKSIGSNDSGLVVMRGEIEDSKALILCHLGSEAVDISEVVEAKNISDLLGHRERPDNQLMPGESLVVFERD